MKLSIIVPIYNCITLLPQLEVAIASLQENSCEIILVDDGSTDNSGAFCDKIAAHDPRVRVLHKPNGGVSSARNAGLDIACGQYIGFWDADDIAKPYMFVKLLTSAEQHGSHMVMGGYEKVHNSCRVCVHIPLKTLISSEKEISQVAWSMAFWNAWVGGKYLPTLYGSVWPNLYKNDLIRKHSIRFPEDIAIGEDLLFNLSYLFRIRVLSVVDEPLYEYNVANSSATRRRNTSLWAHYCSLLHREEQLLQAQYGSCEELTYNLHRQRIHYAINVGEEQICVFLDKRQAKNALRELCADTQLQASATYIIKRGKTVKERVQAMLIRGKLAGLIRFWLK